MQRVIVTKPQLYYEKHTYLAGDQLDLDDQIAKDFEDRGLVRKPTTPRVLYTKLAYETKVITPEAPAIEAAPEVGARPPFRDVSVRNEEPEAVAPESDSVLSGTDVRKQGTLNRGRWRGRA